MTSFITPNKTLTIKIYEPRLNYPNKSLTLKNSAHQVQTQQSTHQKRSETGSPIPQQNSHPSNIGQPRPPNKSLTFNSTHPQPHPNTKLTFDAFGQTEPPNGATFSPPKWLERARSLRQGVKRCTLLRQRLKKLKKSPPTKPSPEVHQAQQLTHLSTTSTSPKVRNAQQSTHLATTKVSLHPNKKLTSMPGNPRQTTVSPISMSSLSIQVLSSKHSTEGVASLVSGEKIQVVNFHHGHATQAL